MERNYNLTAICLRLLPLLRLLLLFLFLFSFSFSLSLSFSLGSISPPTTSLSSGTEGMEERAGKRASSSEMSSSSWFHSATNSSRYTHPLDAGRSRCHRGLSLHRRISIVTAGVVRMVRVVRVVRVARMVRIVRVDKAGRVHRGSHVLVAEL